MTNEGMFSNYAEATLRAQVSLSAAGAVSSTRGDGMSCTKTDTGEYTLVYKQGGGVKLVTELKAAGSIKNASACATTRIDVTSVSQDSDSGDITVVFETNDGAAAADEDTAALVVNVEVVIQTARMSNPLA